MGSRNARACTTAGLPGPARGYFLPKGVSCNGLPVYDASTKCCAKPDVVGAWGLSGSDDGGRWVGPNSSGGGPNSSGGGS